MTIEVRFERAERGDQDAGGDFLRDAAAGPALLQCPLLERELEPDDMPQARAAGRSQAADGDDGAPYLFARGFGAQPGLGAAGAAGAQQIAGAQRLELRAAKESRKVSPAARIAAVIAPRRSIAAKISMLR